jgi:SAM-dependent methyltransferase
VREWLDGQAAGGMIDYDSAADTYTLSDEAAFALADDTSPAFVARGMNAIVATCIDAPKLVDVFRGDGGFSWGDHHDCLFKGTEWFFRTGYRAMLATTWIPALTGVQEKLERGAKVADVGCGHGASTVLLALAYPASTIVGFDADQGSVDAARKRAADAGLSDRVRFEVAPAAAFPGRYDLVCFFDCLHDMGDPAGACAHVRDHLAPGGTLMLIEPFANDDLSGNLTPVGAAYYGFSTLLCTPSSLSQEVGTALGAQAGEARLRDIVTGAGFTTFRRVAETPFNIVLEARVS